MATTIRTWLDFAMQQIAAESYLNQLTTVPGGLGSILGFGNNNPSIPGRNDPTAPDLPGKTRMTVSQAAYFSSNFDIIDHLPNTASGFSATLMRNRTTGEYTLSFRSTEYPADADGGDRSRDITGAEEIQNRGQSGVIFLNNLSVTLH